MTEALSPLGVYVHWPYCARICPYCDFNVVRDRGRGEEQAALIEAILADLREQAARLGPRRLVSIFLGGGTPSLMRPEWAARIIETAHGLWPAAPDLEISLEANPTDAETRRYRDFAAAGVGRLSLGVQALEDEALRFLGRDHSAAEGLRALEAAQGAFARVSADLIYARPGQTEAAWRQELAALIAMGPEHISPYQLTIEGGTAFDRAVRRRAWAPADPDLAADLYDATQEVLGGAGLEAYEVSNHARGPAARSRHNLVYWTGADYVGAGPGAHGRLTLEGGRTATVAARRIGDYIARVTQAGTGWDSADVLEPLAAAEERLLMGLRIEAGTAFSELAPLGLAATSPMVTAYREAGLLRVTDGRLAATAAGRLVLDRLTADLAMAGGRP